MKTNATIPLPVPPQMLKEIRAAAKKTTLSQADVMRQSIRIGLPQFVKQFSTSASLPAGE